MANDQTRWNNKYQNRLAKGLEAKASSWLKGLESQLTQQLPGRALDLACGLGGNSLLLASWGFEVDAVDISDLVISHLAEQLQQTPQAVHPLCMDLDQAPFPQSSYQIILNFHYLNRSLFPAMSDALAPGGLLVFQTFYHEPDLKTRKPMNPAYLLKKGELATAFPGLKTLFFDEIVVDPDSERPRPLARFIGKK